MRLTRRHVLTRCADGLALAATTLLVACQSPPQPITVTNPPAAANPTTAPAPAASPASSPAAAGASPVAGGSPAASPAAAAAASPAAKPAASPAAVASASPSPAAVAAGVTGKPQYQMNATHTGRSPHTGPHNLKIARTFNTNQPNLRPDDAAGPGPDIQSSTAIGPDNTIYATNFIGWLLALKDSPSQSNALDLAWRFRPAGSSPFHCTPVVGRDNATIYATFTVGAAAAARSNLFAVRAPSSGVEGQIVWQADLGPGPIQNSPTMGPDGTLYVVNVPGVLSAVDSSNGQVKWTAQTGNGQQAQFGQTVKVAPAVGSDGTVYTTTLTEGLVAVSPPSSGNQGTVKWKFNFDDHLGPTPLVTTPVTANPNRGQDGVGSGASATIGPDGTIYIGANNSNFYAVNPDGSQKWLYEAERELAGIWTTAALSSDASVLYFSANKGGMYALNARDGSLKWQFNIIGSVYSSAALDAGGTLYTGSTVGHVFSVSSTDGDYYTDLDVGAPVWSAPSIRPDGTVVVGDRNGRIIVLSG
jgi:outer membrane protein assembly factor BamB